MALRTMEQQEEEILKHLKSKEVRKIILLGEAGVGKTWVAREVSYCAMSEGICFATLWVSMNRKFDSKSLYENIASQLSLTFTSEEWEDDFYDEIEENLETLKKKISVKLEEKRSLIGEPDKYLLLILDDEGSKMNEDQIMPLLNAVIPLNHQNMLKTLVTSGKNDSGPITHEAKVIKVDLLSRDEALALFGKSLDKRVFDCPHFQSFSYAIAEKSKGLPAGIIAISGALNCIAQHHPNESELAILLEKAANYEESMTTVNSMLHCAYDMLENSVMINCFWHCIEFFDKYGGVHYNELIAHWIMEGYIAFSDDIKKAYEEGHSIIMEFIDRGMLKIQEDNFVVMEGAMLKMIDHRRIAFAGTASLGLPSVLENDEWEGLRRITQTDGMLKTFLTGEKGKKESTVLIDGSFLCWEVPETFIQHMKWLEVLALFNLKLKKLPESLSTMKKLLVLVLRGCDLLQDIEQIAGLETLYVLEISGASSLKMISDNFFKFMLHLRSLNLCGLQVESLPSSLFNLNKLQWLILRECSHLSILPSLRQITNLEVLDLSGATSLCKLLDRTLENNPKLQLLDLSNTKIERLPFLSNLLKLTRLLLRGCKHLTRLPILETLFNLKILDLSGATAIQDLLVEFFKEKDHLKILDLSGTKITKLPPNICNLSELNSGCSRLVKLPWTKALTDLDLSNASLLEKIEDQSFEHLKYLRYLNLSNTKFKSVPSISDLRNLRQLLIKDCSLLENMPEMEGLLQLMVLDLSGCERLSKLPHLNSLPSLDVLNLSGCIALTEIEDGPSQKLTSRLQRVNLAETKIKHLPFLCNPGNLSQLVLKNCIKLEKLPPLESLSKLEELDLSGTSLVLERETEVLEHMAHLQILKLSGKTNAFAFISNLSSLIQLSLKCCSGLKTVPSLNALTKLEVLDLSETDVGSLPSLDNLHNLRELFLSKCSNLENLPDLTSLIHLEVLDLSGTRIKELPLGIPELTCLKRLNVPDLKIIQQFGWEKIKRLPEELNWDECGTFEPAGNLVGDKKPSVLVNGTNFFQLLKENTQLLESCYNKLHFSIHSPMGKDQHYYCDSTELIFNDVYFETRDFPYYKKQSLSLELHGFDSFPSGVEDVLKRVEYISLVDMFISCLSELGNLEKVKGCWLERCNKVKNIFVGTETDIKVVENLEILWVSNLPNLETFCGAEVQIGNFQSLSHLCLDCCPMIQTVFTSPHNLPVNLKTLRIKFCDNLKTVVEDTSQVAKGSLSNLSTFQLLNLPELTSIGLDLPSLKEKDIRECPKLQEH